LSITAIQGRSDEVSAIISTRVAPAVIELSIMSARAVSKVYPKSRIPSIKDAACGMASTGLESAMVFTRFVFHLLGHCLSANNFRHLVISDNRALRADCKVVDRQLERAVASTDIV
jgi:hypothetical protein